MHTREDIIGCSRTDSKVHANSYFFNMPTKLTIPAHKFVEIMNRALPEDICVLSCKEVDIDFHARYHSKGKEYIYKVYNKDERNVFLSKLALHYKLPIDENFLNEQAQALVGKHDFTSLCSMKIKKDIPTVKTIEYINVYREGDFVYFKIKADGFLYKMARIIVGTLLYVGEGKIPPNTLGEILEKKDRTLAGKTAEPYGLYLNKVFY